MNLSEFLYTVVLKPRPLRLAANCVLRTLTPKRKRLGSAWWVPNPNDPVVSGAAALGLYERSETAFFTRVCKPGMTFIDIGANTGYYSAWAISLMRGRGRILAFEPDPESRRYLEATRSANMCAMMTVVPVAASDHNGETELYLNKDNRGDNRLYANELCGEAIRIDCRTIDEVLRDSGIESVDLVKMDVQGYEGHVLRGMRETLQRSPNLTLLMEFWPYGLTQAGSAPSEILSMIEESGFTVKELLKNGATRPIQNHPAFISSLPGRKYSNIVAVRNSADR